MLTDLGLSTFDAELRVPSITRLRALEHVLDAVDLFPRRQDLQYAMAMLNQAFKDEDENDADGDVGRLNIGIKKLLSIAEMARQEPEAVAERLTSRVDGSRYVKSATV